MPNRQLTTSELKDIARPLLAEIRQRLQAIAGGDDDLLMQRVALKKAKRADQENLCALCHEPLPAKGSVLDRLEAMDGYTMENTRVLCPNCDTRVQTERGYK